MSTLAEYPFTPQTMTVDGHRMSFLDEGSGPVVVMVHGNPSWSYLYRNLVTELKKTHRCIVPDHIGCGLSGSVQHFAGMKTSKVIVAINTDKDAPIFTKSDYGIIGDLFEVVPVLTRELKKQG